MYFKNSALRHPYKCSVAASRRSRERVQLDSCGARWWCTHAVETRTVSRSLALPLLLFLARSLSRSLSHAFTPCLPPSSLPRPLLSSLPIHLCRSLPPTLLPLSLPLPPTPTPSNPPPSHHHQPSLSREHIFNPSLHLKLYWFPKTRYGNRNADELMKSIFLNVTKDGRYFIALQSRKLRWGVNPKSETRNPKP